MKFKLKELREMRRMSYEQLAQKSGVARSYIQRIESNDNSVNPSARILCKLAKALDVSVEMLFECD